MKDPDTALQLAFEALEKFPDSEDLLTLIGNAYSNKEEYEKAIEYCNKALQINPDYSMAYFWLGNIYSDMEDHQKAAENNMKAIEKDPDYYYAMNNLANDLSEMGRHEEAMEWFKRALKIQPDDALVCRNLFGVYGKLGNYPELIKYYKKAMKIEPDSCLIKSLFAISCIDAGKPEKAKRIINQLLKSDINDLWTIYNIACTFSRLKEKEKAIEYLQKAINKDPICIKDAVTDTDFDNIRNEPEFITLTRRGKKR
jgi:tetratricopeptide (TPR) repeat protein